MDLPKILEFAEAGADQLAWSYAQCTAGNSAKAERGVDFETCFSLGVQVLGCGPGYAAQAVAQYPLGLAIDLCRGLSREGQAFTAGTERYLGGGNANSLLMGHRNFGFIAFSNLGLAPRPLLTAFNPRVCAYDPWLPDAILREADVLPYSLDVTLSQSHVISVLATVTSESKHLLGLPRLGLIPTGARSVLVSRAAVVDYDVLFDQIEAGLTVTAVDVWPPDSVAACDRDHGVDGAVLSTHRAGGIPAAFKQVGDIVIDNHTLIDSALPPVRRQPAARESIARYRNRLAAPTPPTAGEAGA